jgi:hypothetical protein
MECLNLGMVRMTPTVALLMAFVLSTVPNVPLVVNINGNLGR